MLNELTYDFHEHTRWPSISNLSWRMALRGFGGMGLSLVTMMVNANTLMSSYDFFPLSTHLSSLMYLGLSHIYPLPYHSQFIFFSRQRVGSANRSCAFSATFILPQCVSILWPRILGDDFCLTGVWGIFGGIPPLWLHTSDFFCLLLLLQLLHLIFLYLIMGTCVIGRSNGNGVVEAKPLPFYHNFIFNLIVRCGSSSSSSSTYAKYVWDLELSMNF